MNLQKNGFVIGFVAIKRTSADLKKIKTLRVNIDKIIFFSSLASLLVHYFTF